MLGPRLQILDLHVESEFEVKNNKFQRPGAKNEEKLHQKSLFFNSFSPLVCFFLTLKF